MKRVIALGFFDGVHLGHAALLKKTAARARELDAVCAACTFDVRPVRVLGQGCPQGDLTTPAGRAALMKAQGVEEVIVLPFDDAMMTTPWDRYVAHYLVARYGACHLVCGEDHRFGYKGEGTAEKLAVLCAQLGIGLDVIPPVTVDGQSVSSTRIRAAVQDGQMEAAAAMLGRPFALEGAVVHGKSLGRTLGFPTVNLTPDAALVLPKRGVYAVKARLDGGETHTAVTNIGVRPTVDDSGAVTVESFLLDFEGDLYGQTVSLDFYRRLRSERRFDSLEALQGAVARDIGHARAFFGE